MLPALGAAIPAAVAAMGGGASAGGGGMMAALGPSIISGGMGLFGGMLGNQAQGGNIKDQAHAAHEAATHSVQWRVADAIKAGIHPLYALGMQPSTSIPMALDDKVGPAMADMGQGLGTALHRASDQMTRDRHQLDMALGHAQLAESDARREMYLSEAARNRQVPGAPVPGLGVQPEIIGQMGQDAGVPGTIEIEPSKIPSGKMDMPSVKAGVGRGYEERFFGFRKRIPMMIPETGGESPEEVISEMNPITWLGLLKANANLYGPEWLKDYIGFRYFGKDPVHNWEEYLKSPKPTGSAVLRSTEDRLGMLKGAAKKWWSDMWKEMGEQVDKGSQKRNSGRTIIDPSTGRVLSGPTGRR